MKIWMWVIYTLNIFLFFNTMNLIMFWILMEMNLVIFIMMMLKSKNISTEKSSSLFYFMIQSMGSMIFLGSCMMKEYFSLMWLEMALTVSMMLKLSLFPLHAWMYKMSKYLTGEMFVILLTLQKLPIIYFFFNLSNNLMLWSMMINFMISPLMIIKSKNIKDLMISSSLNSIMWLMLMTLKSEYFFFMYFVMYYSILMMFFLEKEGEEIMKMSTFMFLVGLPPMSMFFFKVLALSQVKLFFSSGELKLIWIFSFMSLLGYFKFMYKILMPQFKCYKTEGSKSKFKIFYIMMMMVILI